jgi:drug/metabolite transporter (DMT)-like permease
LAIFIAMLFWGFSFIWTKLLLQYYKPITIVTLRLIISSVFLIIIGLSFSKLQRIRRKDFGSLLMLAFFQPFLYFIGETIGLNYVTATVSSVLIATIPLFSQIATWFFFRDKLKIINVIGILISIIGVVLVILNDKFVFKASLNGILLMGLAVFSAVNYSILVINISKKYNIYSIITYQNFIGIFLFMPFFFYLDFGHFVNVKLSIEIIKPLIALSIFASSLAFMLFTYGIRELGIVKANAMSNLIPVFTAVFSFLILDEKLILINIFGIFIVLSGLFLSQLKKKVHLQNLIIPFKKINWTKK